MSQPILRLVKSLLLFLAFVVGAMVLLLGFDHLAGHQFPRVLSWLLYLAGGMLLCFLYWRKRGLPKSQSPGSEETPSRLVRLFEPDTPPPDLFVVRERIRKRKTRKLPEIGDELNTGDPAAVEKPQAKE